MKGMRSTWSRNVGEAIVLHQHTFTLGVQAPLFVFDVEFPLRTLYVAELYAPSNFVRLLDQSFPPGQLTVASRVGNHVLIGFP
jgi:hypothetical protein